MGWALAVAAGIVAGIGCGDDEPETHCFVGRTRVRTPSGDRKLEDLRVGDEILAWDPDTGALAVRKVVAILAHPPTETFALDAGDAHVEGVTKSHPLWVASRSAWVEVGALALGDVLTVLERGGERVATRVLEAIRPTGRREPVFDISVEGPEHTFFADDVLVHNKSVAPECHPDCPWYDAGRDGAATDAGDAGGDGAATDATDATVTDAGSDADAAS